MNSSSGRNLLIAIALLVAALLVWGVLIMPDQRTTGQKIGDAVDALPQGIDKAGRELEDRKQVRQVEAVFVELRDRAQARLP